MEENRTDTPEVSQAQQEVDAFDTAALQQFGSTEGSDNDNLPVENAFFQAEGQTAEEAPQTEQAPPVQETPSQDAKNDERRYQYWQSQAAKRENELKELKAEVEQAKAQVPAQQPVQQQAETVEEFPPPPQAPKRPARYSREEAWSDPSSESARYLDEKEAWDSEISQYNELKHQYDLAVMQEKLDNQSKYLETQEQQRVAKIEQGRQIAQISEHVQGHYGLTPSESQEFIRTMSNPESISMDNLVQLFRMNQAAGQETQATGPSEAFQQSKNAQQVPSPMGVMPSQGTQPQRDDADSIMDSLIKSHNSKNPWS
tara:strand:+ start:2701 stop:3642 length:942 start_codon:yes stop_codon:yes gene_type:complete